MGSISFLNEELGELGTALLFFSMGDCPSLEASERLCGSTSWRYSVVRIPSPKVLNMECQGHHNIRGYVSSYLLL